MTDSEAVPEVPRTTTPLSELALLFLRLGTTAFGGPAAHIAMMRRRGRRRRRLADRRAFPRSARRDEPDPGPQLHRDGDPHRLGAPAWSGSSSQGVSFILPAMLITGAVGWAYVRFGSLPRRAWLLYGIKPVVIGSWFIRPSGPRPNGRPHLAASTPRPGALRGLARSGVHELVILFGAGAVVAAVALGRGATLGVLAPFLPAPSRRRAIAALTLPGLFWVFFKIGSVLFGSGYVLLAFLRADLVERLHWLTESQLIDAIAAGQLTPGPVFTTRDLHRLLAGGAVGALVATAGIFLPAFVFVAAQRPAHSPFRAHRRVRSWMASTSPRSRSWRSSPWSWPARRSWIG